MTHLDPNDPRFTAKALGEEETQPINPDASEEFESLQDFAQTLKSELKARDEKEALTEEQKERVQSAIQFRKKKLLKFPLWINAVAASLVLALVGIFSYKVLDRSKPTLVTENPLSADLTEIVSKNTQDRSKATSQIADYRREISPIERAEGQLAQAQTVPVAPSTPPRTDRPNQAQQQVGPDEEAVFELEPFSVEDDQSSGYLATSTLAGSRLRTELTDLGGASNVASTEFSNEQKSATGGRPQAYQASAETARAPGVDSNGIAAPQKQEQWNREAYDRIVENPFKSPADHPLSTFSIDVDTASYANMRRYLTSNRLPPADAIRIEEMINYFSYDYHGPEDERPFTVQVDSTSTPWNTDHRLVRIGLQGKSINANDRPDANLVFLIDVSGSMSDQNKLPLVQRSMNLLVDQMEARDRIAVVVYAGATGLALPSTTANNKETIQHAINNLRSGGSTNGGAGIELAYSLAQKHLIEGGINRVILCTDGDFNVGTTNRGSLTRLIEEKAKSGVFFSILGFGMGNYQDATMEELSNKGNGNYSYVDSFREARKVFVDDMLGTLFTIAKDVKIQVEFNPTQVSSYRLIGYENRVLAKEDFNDDSKDAGEIGAGHSVTALYEVVPAGLRANTTPSVDALKYQTASRPSSNSSEMLTVKLRFKQPDEDVSQLIEQPFTDSDTPTETASEDVRFASAVASFGMLLRNSEYSQNLTLHDVLELATESRGNDTGGRRSEFIELIEKAIALTPEEKKGPASSGGESR